MKKVFISTILLLTVSASLFAQKDNRVAAKSTVKKKIITSVPLFKNLIDSFSYAAGYNVATNMQAQGINQLNTALMTLGVEDVYNKRVSKLSPDLINSCMQKQLDNFAAQKGLEEKSKGLAFLETNKKREGVITLASGLQYEVIKNGAANSPTPKSIDTVEVNYIGTLANGTEFDNSFKRGEPAAFPVMGVIKGWIEILQLMRKGDHWKVFIPSDLAYGAGGAAGGAIPPNAVLIFEITLESIRPAVNNPAAQQ